MKRFVLLLLLLLASVCSAQVEHGGLTIPGDGAVQIVKKSGGPTWGVGVFDGVDDYFTTANASFPYDTFTFSAFVNIDTATKTVAIIGRSYAASYEYFKVYNYTTTLKFGLQICDTAPFMYPSWDAGARNQSQWQHLAVVFTKPVGVMATATWYIDGVATSSTYDSANASTTREVPVSTSKPFRIGSMFGTNVYMSGKIARPVIIPRALAATEVADLYSAKNVHPEAWMYYDFAQPNPLNNKGTAGPMLNLDAQNGATYRQEEIPFP